MHNILNFKKIKNYNYLNLSLYFLPIAIIIGNSVINLINLILFILLTIEIIKKNKSFFIKYKNYLNFFIFFSIIFFLNIFFSVDKAKSIIDEGKLGGIINIRGRYGHGGRPGMEKEWRC